jgi:hypothetical protein
MLTTATLTRQSETYVPYAKDGSFFHPTLKKPRTGTYTVGKKGFEVTFNSFDDALQYLRAMPVASWRRPNKAGNWGGVSAVNWGPMPEL